MNLLLRLCGITVVSMLAAGTVAQGQAAAKAWIAKSNAYTQQLLDVQLKHAPERGSRQGLVQFDKLISNPTLADQLETRKELEAVLVKLKAAQTTEKGLLPPDLMRRAVMEDFIPSQK